MLRGASCCQQAETGELQRRAAGAAAPLEEDLTPEDGADAGEILRAAGDSLRSALRHLASVAGLQGQAAEELWPSCCALTVGCDGACCHLASAAGPQGEAFAGAEPDEKLTAAEEEASSSCHCSHCWTNALTKPHCCCRRRARCCGGRPVQDCWQCRPGPGRCLDSEAPRRCSGDHRR